MKPTHIVLILATLAALCTGCELLGPTATPSPAPTPTATLIQAAATLPRPSATPTLAATALPKPSELPSPAPTRASATPTVPKPPVEPKPTPLWQAGLYIQPDGLWTVLCPAMLRPEKLDDRLTLLSTADRATLAAVDSYVGTAGEVGNTGEGLRNRARTALSRIYGQAFKEAGVVTADYPWETGIAFTTTSGGKGEAIYAQPGRERGDFRIYGFVFSYKGANEKTALPMLQAVRDSFKPLAALQLQVKAGSEPLWALFSSGLRRFNPDLPDEHLMAIYARSASGWQERGQLILGSPDYVDPGAVKQVPLEPGRLWLTVDGGAGAHSGTFQLISYKDGALRIEAEGFNSSPGAGSVADLNGDGTLDVILNQTESYVFCYACSVRYPQYQVLRWDGQRLVEVHLTRLPEASPAELRNAINRAVELAQAGLWKDAQAAAERAPQSNDAIAVWDAALIRLHADAFAEQVREGGYPLLGNVFYGDYAAAMAIVRRFTPAQIFDPQGPLVAGTPAEASVDALAEWMERAASAALQAEPKLAAAYYLRGWATGLADPGSAQALSDIQRAAQLEPQDALYAQSLAYRKARP